MPRRTHGAVHRLPSKRTNKIQMDEVPSDDEQAVLSSQDSDVSSVHEAESAHAKRVRLTRRIVQEAKRQIGSDEEELNMYSMKLKEEALFEKGKLMVSIALKLPSPKLSDIRFLKGHRRAVTCICVTDDNSFAFSGGKDSTIIKWCIKEFRRIQTIFGGKRCSSYPFHTGPILSIAISSDCKYLASSSMDGTVIIWEPDSMSVIMKLKRHRTAVTAVAFRKYSHMLFTADRSGRVCVWNLPLSEPIQDQGARTNIEILGLCGLTAERCVSCSGFGDPGISLWKVPEEVCVQYTPKDITETAIECVYAVRNDTFIGGSATNKLYIWHINRGSPVFTVSPAHPERLFPPEQSSDVDNFRCPVATWVSAIAGLPGTDLIATGTSTGHVQFWRFVHPSDTSSGNLNRSRSQNTHSKLERLVDRSVSLTGFINSLAFTQDRCLLLVGLGQEYRLGKWEPRRRVTPAICLIPLMAPTDCKSASLGGPFLNPTNIPICQYKCLFPRTCRSPRHMP